MQGNPDHQTGFNLVLCYYALEDGPSMKKAFQRLAAVPVQVNYLRISLSKKSHDEYVLRVWCVFGTHETRTTCVWDVEPVSTPVDS